MNKKITPSFTTDNPWSEMTLDSIVDRNHQRQVYFNHYPQKTCMLTGLITRKEKGRTSTTSHSSTIK